MPPLALPPPIVAIPRRSSRWPLLRVHALQQSLLYLSLHQTSSCLILSLADINRELLLVAWGTKPEYLVRVKEPPLRRRLLGVGHHGQQDREVVTIYLSQHLIGGVSCTT